MLGVQEIHSQCGQAKEKKSFRLNLENFLALLVSNHLGTPFPLRKKGLKLKNKGLEPWILFKNLRCPRVLMIPDRSECCFVPSTTFTSLPFETDSAIKHHLVTGEND